MSVKGEKQKRKKNEDWFGLMCVFDLKNQKPKKGKERKLFNVCPSPFIFQNIHPFGFFSIVCLSSNYTIMK